MKRRLREGDRFRFKEPQTAVLTCGTNFRAFVDPGQFWIIRLDEIKVYPSREFTVKNAGYAIDGTWQVETTITLAYADIDVRGDGAKLLMNGTRRECTVIFRQKVEDGSCSLGEEVPVEVVIID